MSAETRRIRCLIEGESVVFTVKVGPDTEVGDLKEDIQSKRALDTLKDVGPHVLELWKLKDSNPIAVKPAATLAERIRSLGDNYSKFADELDPTDSLFSIFPGQPPTSQLHIIVKVPDVDRHTSKRARLSSPISEEQDDWFFELHSKIWNRKDLSPDIYHETCVTREHYKLLQSHLKKRYPNSSSSEVFSGSSSYLLDSDVLDKLRILRSTEASSLACPLSNPNQSDQSHVEGAENVNDIDDELDSLFPTTIRYMDFSSLGLQKRTRRFPMPLLLREEYNVLSRKIENMDSVIVSGQPGIGKTAFLHFKVIEHMLSGKPFLYQTIDGIVYHVTQAITRITSWSSSEEPIVAFVDADRDSVEPKIYITLPNVKIILASPPHGAKQRWVKQHNEHVAKLVMALWSPGEFFISGLFLCGGFITHERLAEAVSYFGRNPRVCFSRSSLAEHRQSIEVEISNIVKVHDIPSLLSKDFKYNRVSHTIFQIYPSDDSRFLSGALAEPVSDWALDRLLIEYERRQADAAAEFYIASRSFEHGETLRGRLWERQVLKYLDSLKLPQTFTIRSLSNSTLSQWTYPGPVRRVNFLNPLFTSLLQDAVEEQEPRHLVPLDPNFPTLDSVLYDPSGPLTCIQVTIREKHPTVVSGLKRVQNWLKRNTSLAPLRPSKSDSHWYLLFVVPEAMAPGFQLQKIEGDTEKNEWAKKVDQYVLGLKEEIVWGRRGVF